jgi:hypothetical protein
VASAPTAKATGKEPIEPTRKPIWLPSEFDDLMDFGLAQHSPNKQWSVGFWDPGPDASQERPRGVRLRDNTTGRIVATVNRLQRPFSVDVSDTGVFGVNDAGQTSELSANLVIFGVVQNACFFRYTDELINPAFSRRINMECESV